MDQDGYGVTLYHVSGPAVAANGTVTLSRSSLSRWTAAGANITLMVTSVSKSGLSYGAASNHDPDGSSNGAAINVTR